MSRGINLGRGNSGHRKTCNVVKGIVAHAYKESARRYYKGNVYKANTTSNYLVF